MVTLFLSPDERNCYTHFFEEASGQLVHSAADTSAQLVSGASAAGLLSRSGLDRKVLKEIWDFADVGRRGSLNFDEFSRALRLVAHAQSGCVVSAALAEVPPVSLPHLPRDLTLGGDAGHKGDSLQRGRSPPRSSPGSRWAPSQQELPTAGRGGASSRSRSTTPGCDRLLPNERDLRKYAQVFCRTARGPINTSSVVSAGEGRALLERSALDADTLRRVWEESDLDRDGALSWCEFVVAMHLVRRLRAGASVLLPGLGAPEELLAHVRSLGPVDRYCSVEMSGRAHSQEAFQHSADAPWPNSRASASLGGASSRSRSTTPGCDRLLPNERDLRKYAKVFCRTARGPIDTSSVVSAGEGRALLERSALDADTLRRVWEESDLDRDGALSWCEFVVAMHLVRRLRAGASVLLPGRGAPEELLAHVRSLGPVDKYCSVEMSGRAHSQEAFQHSADAPWPNSRAAADEGSFGESVSEGRTRAKKKRHQSRVPDEGKIGNSAFEANGTDGFGDIGNAVSDSYGDHRSSNARCGGFEALSAWDKQPKHGGFDEDYSASKERAEQHASISSLQHSGKDKSSRDSYFNDALTADKRLSARLRKEVDDLDAELSYLERRCLATEQTRVIEIEDTQRALEERVRLERELAELSVRSVERHSQRRESQDEAVLLHRSQAHYRNEQAFLQKLFEEGLRDTQALQQSIDALEQSHHSLLNHMGALHAAREALQAQMQREEDLAAQERREALEASRKLQAMLSSRSCVEALLIAGGRIAAAAVSKPSATSNGHFTQGSREAASVASGSKQTAPLSLPIASRDGV